MRAKTAAGPVRPVEESVADLPLRGTCQGDAWIVDMTSPLVDMKGGGSTPTFHRGGYNAAGDSSTEKSLSNSIVRVSSMVDDAGAGSVTSATRPVNSTGTQPSRQMFRLRPSVSARLVRSQISAARDRVLWTHGFEFPILEFRTC